MQGYPPSYPQPQQNLNISNFAINAQNSSRVLSPKIGSQTPTQVQFYQGQYYQPYAIMQNQQLTQQKQQYAQQVAQKSSLPQQKQQYVQQVAQKSPLIANRKQYSVVQQQNISSPEIKRDKQQNSNTKLTQKMNYLISEVDRLTVTVDELLKENEEWREKYKHTKHLLSQFKKQNKQTTQNQKQNNVSIEKTLSPLKFSQGIASQFIPKEIEEELKKLQDENKSLKEQLINADQILEETKKHSIANNEKLLEAIEIYQSDALSWKQKTETLEELIEEIQKEKNSKSDKLKLQRLQQELAKVEIEEQEQKKEFNSKINSLEKKNSELQQKLLQYQKQPSIKVDIQTKQVYEDQIQKLSEELEALNEENQNLLNSNYDYLFKQEKNKQLEQEIKQLPRYHTELSIEKEQSPVQQKQYQSQDPTPHNFNQNKPSVQQDNKDDYLVRQLRKFQEIQQSNQLGKKVNKKEIDKKMAKKTTKK